MVERMRSGSCGVRSKDNPDLSSYLGYLNQLLFLPCRQQPQHHHTSPRPFLSYLCSFSLSLSLSFSWHPCKGPTINYYPSSVPGTSSGATMVRFSGGSPSTDPPAGHEHGHCPLPEIWLWGDIPHNPGQSRSVSTAPALASPNERLSRRFPRVLGDRPAGI